MIVNPKPFDQMTHTELAAELALWDDRIARGVFAGRALALALNCRNLCATWLGRRAPQAIGAAA